MSIDQTRVSIIIPAYNYAQLLPRALTSVVRQRASHHEIVVIDDGSTDDTPAVVEALLRDHPGQFRYVRKENGGLASVRNHGIDIARSPYLIFLDADDELVEGALALIDRHIEAHPQSRLIIGGHVAVEPDGSTRTHLPRRLPDGPVERVRAYLIDKRITLANGACVMHREVFARGRYPERFRNAEDLPVFAQVLANDRCTTIDSPIARIHKHRDSLRHQFAHARAAGVALAEEVFSPERVGEACQVLKREYLVQRNLSLFRTAYIAQDRAAARAFFRDACRLDWRVIFKLAYSKKALRVWLNG
jgi:glycosyltransferase involved in cell wall biosynthesis